MFILILASKLWQPNNQDIIITLSVLQSSPFPAPNQALPFPLYKCICAPPKKLSESLMIIKNKNIF